MTGLIADVLPRCGTVRLLTGKVRTARRSLREDVCGLTLVEMMVALTILSVVFAAAASALINFSQSSLNTERRVEATSLANELHERLQGLPWDATWHDETQLGALTGVEGYDSSSTPKAFDGNDIVARDPDPDVDPYEPLPLIPEGVEDADDYDYIYQVVTWVDRPGVDPPSIKRFTTVIGWSILGREVEARLESERSPTAGELEGEVANSVAISFFPSSVLLVEDGVNGDGDVLRITDEPVTIQAVFPNDYSLAVTSATASVPTGDAANTYIDVTLERLGTRGIAGEPFSSRVFEGTLPAGSGPIVGSPSSASVQVVWDPVSDPYQTSSVLSFDYGDGGDGGDGGGDGGDAEDPRIDAVSLTPGSFTSSGNIEVGKQGNTYPFCKPLTVVAEVLNASPAISILVGFGDTVSTTTMELQTPASGYSDTGPTLYEFQWPAGFDSPWEPKGNPATTVGQITVAPSAGDFASELRSTSEFVVAKKDGQGNVAC